MDAFTTLSGIAVVCAVLFAISGNLGLLIERYCGTVGARFGARLRAWLEADLKAALRVQEFVCTAGEGRSFTVEGYDATPRT